MQVPPDLSFVDDNGRTVKLGDYFGKKPLILNLVYYNCTMLCGEALAGLTGADQKLVKFASCRQGIRRRHGQLQPTGDPRNRRRQEERLLERYGRPGAAAGWHFLTGPPESINALTKAVGFQYQYDSRIGQYAHATAIMVLTPEGQHRAATTTAWSIRPRICALGLVQASQGKIGNLADAGAACTATTTTPRPGNMAPS